MRSTVVMILEPDDDCRCREEFPALQRLLDAGTATVVRSMRARGVFSAPSSDVAAWLSADAGLPPDLARATLTVAVEREEDLSEWAGVVRLRPRPVP